MKKPLLIILFSILFCGTNYAQDSLRSSSYGIGFTSALIGNSSAIGYSNGDIRFRAAGHKTALGYSEGVCFLYFYRQLVFEFAVQYAQENDKFNNIPSVLSEDVTIDSLHYFPREYLDYTKPINVSTRTNIVTFLLKVNVEAIKLKKLSVGFGLGIAPCLITSEMIYNQQSDVFIKLVNKNYEGESQIKAVGSLNLLYTFNKRLFMKVSPLASWYLTGRRIGTYYIKPFSAGLELGLFYKIR